MQQTIHTSVWIKNVITLANQKPWMTNEVFAMLKAGNAAYSGEKEGYLGFVTPLCNLLLDFLMDRLPSVWASVGRIHSFVPQAPT